MATASPACRLARAALFAALLQTIAGCAYHVTCVRPETPKAPEFGEVQVTFLGAGGFLIRYRPSDDASCGQADPRCNETVLLAPFYSNPTIGEIATQKVHSDQRLIDALLPPVSDAKAILVGHSHYDHLMDVPYVALKKATGANVYGNDAMTRLLDPIRGELQGRRLISLERKAKTLPDKEPCTDCAGAAEPVGERIRIWPIVSEHSNQFKIQIPLIASFPPVHLWRGDLLRPVAELPDSPSGWVEGTTLAYVIDFLDKAGNQVVFRVYYQDSATRQPFGFPPRCVIGNRTVDLALLCVGGSETIEHNPAEILEYLKPRFVIGGHWEDFFNPRHLPLPKTECASKPTHEEAGEDKSDRIDQIPLGKPKAWMKRTRAALPKDSLFTMPCPDSVTYFRPHGDRWEIRDSTADWKTGTRPAQP